MPQVSSEMRQIGNGNSPMGLYISRMSEALSPSLLRSNGRTNWSSVDSSWTQIKEIKETEWIRRFRTASPYSLNDKTGEQYHLNTTSIVG